MLFDITNYNQTVLFLAFIFATLILFLIFNRNIYSLLDPMAMHIFWIAGNVSFLTAFVAKYGLSDLSFLFILFFIIYIAFLKIFLPKTQKSNINDNVYLKIIDKEKKIKWIYGIIAFIYFLSKIPFFTYALSNPSVASWFLYRFVDLQGRDPLFRMVSTGSEVYFYLFSFILVFLLKTWKKRCSALVIAALMIGIFSGGRASVLGGLLYLGAFIFYFNRFFGKVFVKKINVIGSTLVVLSLLLAAVVSSLYEKDASFTDGISIIINRFIAVGDGLEYYMIYNGPKNIHSGIGEYFMAIFGVYVKSFTHVEYKNVGTQLMELVVGEVSFAQGSNFVFPLQSMVLGYYAWILYIPGMAFVVSKFRINRSSSLVYLPLSFFLSYHCFTIATDIEYATLCIISGVLVYFALIYPILKLKF